jgi:hypothetical protein
VPVALSCRGTGRWRPALCVTPAPAKVRPELWTGPARCRSVVELQRSRCVSFVGCPEG